MRYITNRLRIALPLMAVLSVIAFSTCKSPVPPVDGTSGDTPDNSNTTTPAPTESKASIQFYHAYLADCVNDTPVKDSLTALRILQNLAKTRINDALNNQVLRTSFGAERLLWGPALSINKERDDYYTCSNLAFCTLYIDAATGNPTLSIGISGTNMIAPYDWFEEDFDVETVQYWLEDTRISTGAKRGFQNLLTLQDPHSGATLDEFLSGILPAQTKPITVAIAGHSLGGTLTQVLSSYLKEQYQDLPLVSLDAWVYAGPTAGNSAFASFLTNQLDHYYAYNNTLDAIPHVWQTNTMNELCNLYNGIEVCHPRNAENPAINGMITYLKHKASLSGVEYTIPGTPEHFTGDPLVLSDTDCAGIRTYIEKMWEFSDKPYPELNTIVQKCAGTEIEWRQFWEFFYYMAEMGHQHTTAYSDYFFGKGSERQKQVNIYVPGKDSYDNFEDGKDILNKFVTNAANYISASSPACNCGG